MFYTNLLNEELKRDGSRSRLKALPSEKKAGKDSLDKLQNEIAAQIIQNDVMRRRSLGM